MSNSLSRANRIAADQHALLLTYTHIRIIMSDFKDMLGIPRENPNANASGLGTKKSKKEVKPKGMSREVWQIVRGNQSSHSQGGMQGLHSQGGGEDKANGGGMVDALVPLVPTHAGLKTKRKVSARKVSWSWQPFRNSARTDGLMLKHWVKKNIGAAAATGGKDGAAGTGGKLLPGTGLEATGYGVDIGGDYAFAKYNKKVEVPEFTEREYERWIANLDSKETKAEKPSENDTNENDENQENKESLMNDDRLAFKPWSKEETEYLFEMLRRFDLRFIVAKDRWSSTASPCERSIEDMKTRYYEVCRALVRARASNKEEAEANLICKTPFDPQHELMRKEALETLLARTNVAHKEEADILAQVKKIESDRRAETHALLQRQQAVFAPNRFAAHEKRAKIEEIRKDFESDMPHHGVPCTTTQTSRDDVQPGVYPRSQRAVEVAAEIAGRDAPNSGLGPRYAKRLDQSVEELGCPEPRNGTKAAVAGWLRLRKQCGVYLTLRKQIASAHEKLVQAGKAVAIQLPPATASGPALGANVPQTPTTADRGGFSNHDGFPAAGASMKQQTIADRKPPGQKTGGLNIGFRDTEEKGGKAEKEKAKPKKAEKRKAETTGAGTRKKLRKK